MSGINGSDQTPIQQEFEANLQAQLDSIKQIQDQQTNLYSKLEVLGASSNISDQSVQDQINDIFTQIETLNNVKNSISFPSSASVQVDLQSYGCRRISLLKAIVLSSSHVVYFTTHPFSVLCKEPFIFILFIE